MTQSTLDANIMGGSTPRTTQRPRVDYVQSHPCVMLVRDMLISMAFMVTAP